MRFFAYDNEKGSVILDDASLLIIKEFEALMESGRNKNKIDKTGKNKELAFKEFRYIYLFLDWESPYFNIPEQDRHKAALEDAGLSSKEFDDPVFRAACKKYQEMQDSSMPLRLLKAAMTAVESQIDYLNHIDLNERDPVTGKPIFKSKDLIAEIKGCKDLIVSLKELETQVKKEIEPSNGLRGNTEAGFYD